MHSLTISRCFVLVHVTVNKQCVPVLTSAGAVAVGNRLVYQPLCGANTVMCLMIKQHVILGYIYIYILVGLSTDCILCMERCTPEGPVIYLAACS